MADLIFNRLTAIWLFLIFATLMSVEAVNDIFGNRGEAAAMTVIVVAYVKIRFVGLDFMELRHAPRLARIAFEAWVAIICSAIIIVQLLGLSV